MKRKGISLIVLIITIVVIIVLATAIIVNLAQTNIIENANEATVKQDFKTMQEELNLYIADEFAKSEGKLDITTVDADTLDEVKEILKSSSKSKYIKYVRIVDGKIVFTQDIDEQIKEWADETLSSKGNEVVVPDRPPTKPTDIVFSVNSGTLKVLAQGATDDSNEVTYEYSIDNENWQESNEFSNLEIGKKYTMYVRAKDNSGKVSESKELEVKLYNQVAINEEVINNNSTVTGFAPRYNNPVIPVGFKTSDKGASWNIENGIVKGWNDGVVIVDEKGNEFVWVPCTLDGKDGTTIYTKRFDEYPKTENIISVTGDAEELPMKDETTRVDETKQIETYEGFYIGRYEAGVPNKTGSPSNSTGVPVTQQGATVWTNILYSNANASAQKYKSTDYVKSGLTTGSSWDTLCAWIHSELDENGTPLYSALKGATWGNYSDTVESAKYDIDGKTKLSGAKRTAGRSEHWKAKNIYDLAGNVYEWSGEKHSSNPICRGSYYGANNRSSSLRDFGWSTSTYDYVGFRVQLYII